jgi:hypothetical protein
LQKLYLVGLTSDLSGLVLSRQRGVKSGGFVVDLDDQLRARLSELYRRHAEAGSRDAAPAGIEEVVPEPELPAEGAAGEVSPRRNAVRSVLTPKEIQAELRSGKTVQEVAGLAGTDTSWIERFLSPILAERRGIVDAVMTGFISRPRQGRSSCNVGQAIVANLRERKAAISPEDLEEGWSVARRNGQWEVTFRYSLRGQHKQAQFAYDPEGGVTAMDEEASVIGWRPPASTRAGAEGRRPEGEPSAAPKAPVGAVAAAKPKAKPKPAPRGDVAAATAALWGATKVTPPTAPARRSSFIGVRKTDAGAGPSKPAAKAGPKAPARPEPARTPARSEPAKAAGRQPPAQPGTRQPPVPAGQPDKRAPGAAEDRSVVARNSASPRPKRLITVEDDEADWRSALAKTRAKRKAVAPGPHQGAPAPKPAPKPAPRLSSQPARPQRKRLPDDWLIGE